MAQKKINQIRRSADTVLFYDGTAWNAYHRPIARLTGARHGKFDPKKPGDTGQVNVLFVDGHSATVSRKDLPLTSPLSQSTAFQGVDQFHGPRNKMRNVNYVRSLNQQG